MLSTNMSTFIAILLSVSSCFCRSVLPSGDGEADQVDHQLDGEMDGMESLSLCAFLSKTRDMLTLNGATTCTDLKKEETSGIHIVHGSHLMLIDNLSIQDAVHEFCVESGQQIIRDSLSKPDPVKSLEDKVKVITIIRTFRFCIFL